MCAYIVLDFDFWFYWMFYDHVSARSLLAKLGRCIYRALYSIHTGVLGLRVPMSECLHYIYIVHTDHKNIMALNGDNLARRHLSLAILNWFAIHITIAVVFEMYPYYINIFIQLVLIFPINIIVECENVISTRTSPWTNIQQTGVIMT